MQGNWKNNVNGWNHKDSKRKRQTHDHRLKDNGSYVVRKFDGWRDKNKKVNPDVFRTETETVIVTKGSYGSEKPIVTTAKVYRAFATWNKVDADGEYILDYEVKTTLFYSKSTYMKKYYKTESRMVNVYTNGNWSNDYHFIEGTDTPIAEYLELSKKQARSLEVTGRRDTQRTIVLPSDMVERAIERKNKIEVKDYDSDGDFIYGKPLPSWKRMTFFNDGKRRKYCQQEANSADRMAIRTFIENQDWEAEIKTHACSKSIAWCVS